jgi:hypothetical protein
MSVPSSKVKQSKKTSYQLTLHDIPTDRIPQFGRWLNAFPPRRPGFSPRIVHVEFVVRKKSEEGFCTSTVFPLAVPWMLPTHLLSLTSSLGRFEALVPRAVVSPQPYLHTPSPKGENSRSLDTVRSFQHFQWPFYLVMFAYMCIALSVAEIIWGFIGLNATISWFRYDSPELLV